VFPNQLLSDRQTSGVAEGGVVRQGKSRRISITIFIISIGSRIYGNRGSGAAPSTRSGSQCIFILPPRRSLRLHTRLLRYRLPQCNRVATMAIRPRMGWALRRNGRARTPATVSLKPTRPAQRADGNQNRDPASESARSQSRYLRPTPARMVPPVPEIPIRLRLWSRIAADIDRL